MQAVDLTPAIDDFVRRLTRVISVERVVLFGSHARGDAHDGSDIDIAVISPEFDGRSTWERQEAIARASVGRAYRLSPIGFSASEYNDPGAHSFLREVIRTGRVVYLNSS
jgi:predicted nucleotidyltransferase